jgi:hypothetical protein
VTAGVGSLIAARRQENAIGWLLLGSGLAWLLTGFAQQYAQASLRTGLPAVGPISALQAFWGPSTVLLALATLLVPDGRLPSPRWRLVVWVALLDILLLVGSTLRRDPASLLPTLSGLLLAAVLVGSAGALLARLRHARGAQRQQLMWVASGSAFLTLVFLGTVAVVFSPFGRGLFGPDRIPADALPVPFAIGFVALPLSIGIAVLRHRLFEIDVLINRALVYGATTAAIAAAFFGGIVVLEAALRPVTGGSELAVAASTLLCFGLFQPLRRRIQRGVDRSFYRGRYDAERTLDEFGVRLRDEVDLDAVRGELLDAVGATLSPAQASVWLRETS